MVVYEEKLLSKGQSANHLLVYCSVSLCGYNFTTHKVTMIRFKVSVSFPVIQVTSALLNFLEQADTKHGNMWAK